LFWSQFPEAEYLNEGVITIKRSLIDLLIQATREAQESGSLPPVSLPEITIEHPQIPEHGDYAASLPLKMARSTGVNPLNIANEIAQRIVPGPDISSITVAPPGYINFTFDDSWLAQQVKAILETDQAYGNIHLGENSRVQLEFVSVNPTGPLHVGHGRGAILGSTLANVLTAAGFQVEKEYYVNDAGNQIDAFSRSLYARYQQSSGIDAEMPAEGYFGSYMVDLAQQIIGEEGDRFLKMPAEEAIPPLGQIGLAKMIEQIKADLELLDVGFDVWFSEQSLFGNGQYQKVMKLLEERSYIAQKEGATWFVSTALGDSKDNVVIRGDGSPTYFASDIAYHYNKFLERNFDKVIDIWGADHQGHISRMKAVISALGIDPDQLEVIISQMVTLRRGGELVRVSKRSGELVTLRELVEEVGADACRFFFLSRSADSQMDFDLELAKKESADNPVYYVQYAHARIASILRLAQERQIDYQDGDVSLLTTEPELTLIRKMMMLPEIVETIAITLQPHHLTYYSQDLATVFHSFYKQCRVVSQYAEDEAITKARLKLVEAAKLVLARTLTLMGMTAPEQM